MADPFSDPVPGDQRPSAGCASFALTAVLLGGLLVVLFLLRTMGII